MESFGELLKGAREASGLSQAELAQRAGIDVRTVRNLEKGEVSASSDTLVRLRGVQELGLPDPADVAAGPDLVPNAYLVPAHDGLQLHRDMSAAFRKPGGAALEQTWLYLDGQSADDWLTLSNSGPYAVAFRDAMPLQRLADLVAARAGQKGLDVHAIGAGDGKSETRFVQLLCDLRADLRLTLLDISPTLVHAAYRYAADALERRGVAVFALVGNFLELSRIPVLSYRPVGSQRRRLYTMFGCTFQNLANELGFLRQAADCAGRGDLLAVDVRLARAPAGDEAAIRAAEPVLSAGPPQSHHEWLGGPIKRHCEHWQAITFRAELLPRGPLPGSYEIDLLADVTMRPGYGERRTYTLLRGKSYDPAQLGSVLDPLGWSQVAAWPYGVRDKPDHVLMLLQRR